MNKNLYGTTSLILASTLVSLKFDLDSLKKSEKKQVTFYFTQSETLKSTITKFWNRTLSVEPHSLFESQKFLKSCIYEGTDGFK